jgi:hypothetical protein
MILIKSLIVLFLILLTYYFYNRLHLLNYFDGREGFTEQTAQSKMQEAQVKIVKDQVKAALADTKTAEAAQAAEAAEAAQETKYTVPSPAKKQKEINNDAAVISDLQDKMNELLKLKDQANEINSDLKK